jgi:glucose/arabinose dehydrogenase
MLCATFAAFFASAFGQAQQAPAPGIPVPTLAGPYIVDTAEQHKVKITVVARGMVRPFSLAFLPNGDMLVTQRGGQLRLIKNGVLQPAPVAGVPAVRVAGSAGLLDLAIDPQFARNNRIYFTYSKPMGTGNENATVLARARWTGSAFSNVEDLLVGAVNARTSGSRIAFGKDGMIYMSTGAPFDDNAQAPESLYGKVLRLTMDGTAPADNPFVGKPGYRPEIFTMGHRDQLGITVHPETGQVLSVEHGPNGGDEVNLIQAGKNYGWPLISYGRQYDGSKIGERPSREGIEDPIVLWIPSIAPSGMLFYTGDKFPQWKGNLFVGSNREGEIPGTGHLERVVFNGTLEELRRESMFTELHQRIRDVRQGPDGFIYVITDEQDGAVLRIEPAN